MKNTLLNKFIPTYIYHTIYDVDFTKLYENNKRYILCDLDNTLIPYDLEKPNDEIRNLVSNLKNIGFEIMIVSNNHLPRIKLFSDELGIKYVSSSKKPLKCGFKKALKILNNPSKNEVITIGDQIMTDIFGSNRMKLDSILVKPIKKKTEKWYTKLNRKMEKIVIKKIEKKYPLIYEEIKEKHED